MGASPPNLQGRHGDSWKSAMWECSHPDLGKLYNQGLLSPRSWLLSISQHTLPSRNIPDLSQLAQACLFSFFSFP